MSADKTPEPVDDKAKADPEKAAERFNAAAQMRRGGQIKKPKGSSWLKE